MDMPWGRELMRQVAELNDMLHNQRTAPVQRLAAAAVKLHEQIKGWSGESRKLIDAIDEHVAGDLGDFLIEVDAALKVAGRLK
jgi:hypothetical protein